MLTIGEAMNSIWTKTCEIDKRDAVNRDMKLNTVIIGAGLAGILTGYKLKEKGIDAVILEASSIAGGQTKNTTAKITSQHGSIYSRLLKQFGTEKARQYANANQEAIRAYESLITSLNIDCDFERADAYVYSLSDEKMLIEEQKNAKLLGLPAEFVTSIKLPLKIKGAVKFMNQAQFNPLRFIKRVSSELQIYENTPVKAVEENTVKTANGYKIQAENIVFSTHFPFINFPGYYFARMHQERSYVVCFENGPDIDGMYIDFQAGGLSFRNYKQYLFVGGGNHRTGENADGGKYNQIINNANSLFPGIKEVTRWSAQDCITTDGVPYIGKYSSGIPNRYVATGFMKWGMTTSMVSAEIISDMITGRKNKNAEVFSPQRFSVNDVKQTCTDGAKSIKCLIKEPLAPASDAMSGLSPGQGKIVSDKDGKRGVYKDLDGTAYVVDIKCPHLGCQLEWNPDEKSWDCPCHGSRFDYRGKLIDNPAQKDLKGRTK